MPELILPVLTPASIFLAGGLIALVVAALGLRAGALSRAAEEPGQRLVLDVDGTVVTIDLDAVGADDPQEVERAVRAARRRTRGLAA